MDLAALLDVHYSGVHVAVLAACLFFLWLLRNKTSAGKLPPGPKGLPIVGYLPYLGRENHVKFRDLSRTYGPVVRVKAGAVNLITLNDFDSIKECLSKRELLSRPKDILFEQAGFSGIVTLNGRTWAANRKFCMRVLQDLGFGNRHMADRITEEVEYLVSKVTDARGSPMFCENYLIPSVSNNVTALLLGSRYPYDDPKRQFLDETVLKTLRIFETYSLINFLPRCLRSLVALPFLKAGILSKIVAQLKDFVRNEVHQHSSTLDPHSNRDFIDGYLKKMREMNDDPESPFTMTFLVGNVLGIFGAASVSVQLVIQWLLLNLADRVDELQSKIQKEIDDVVGRDRAPSWEDSKRMPLTLATIWETFRWRTPVPLNLPRGVEEDTYFRGYLLPLDSVVLANIWAVHMDPKLWENPEEFNPGRFLSKDGTGLVDKPEYLIPFSIGSRKCPGETLATVEIFLYLTGILQKFAVLPEEGKAIDMTCRSLLLCMPEPQKLRFVAR